MDDVYKRTRDKIVLRLSRLLKDENSYSFRKEECRQLNGVLADYFLNIQRDGEDRFYVNEISTPRDGRGYVSWNWSFILEEDGWTCLSAVKNNKGIGVTLLSKESLDLLDRLEQLEEEKGFFSLELPEQDQGMNTAFTPYVKMLYTSVYMLIAASVLVFGVFFMLFVSNIQYNRMTRIVNSLNVAIDRTADMNDIILDDVALKLGSLEQEITTLRSRMDEDQQAFQYTKLNLADNIREKSEPFKSYEFTRYQAYEYLASRVESSSSYGELYYYYNRLPSNNFQAAILLAVEKDNLIPLSEFSPVFSHFQHPVRLDGKENLGEGFVITSTYQDERVSPLGTGEIKPHHAVDIANINNIVKVSDSNIIIRDSGTPGAVVTVADGTVVSRNYSASYGWFFEIEHELTDEVRALYPGASHITTFYTHMDQPGNWEIGDEIEADVKIGDIGNSGVSTGPHLHFEVRIYQVGGEYPGQLGYFDAINPYYLSSTR